MGKTRDLFKKIGDIKGTFHARMGMIKDRSGKDLTEAERLKRGGKNTQNQTVRKHLTGGFLYAVLDLSGILCSLFIPEYSSLSWG